MSIIPAYARRTVVKRGLSSGAVYAKLLLNISMQVAWEGDLDLNCEFQVTVNSTQKSSRQKSQPNCTKPPPGLQHRMMARHLSRNCSRHLFTGAPSYPSTQSSDSKPNLLPHPTHRQHNMTTGTTDYTEEISQLEERLRHLEALTAPKLLSSGNREVFEESILSSIQNMQAQLLQITEDRPVIGDFLMRCEYFYFSLRHAGSQGRT